MLKKHQGLIPCSFSYKLVCVDDKFSIPIVLYKGENTAYKSIPAIFEEYEYCKKVMYKQFNAVNIHGVCDKQEFSLYWQYAISGF